MITVLAGIPFVGPMIARLIAALGGPLAKVGLIAAVALGIYTTGFIRGKHRAETRCQTAALRSELAAKQIDLTAALSTAEANAAALQQEQDAVAANQEKIREYERALAARPAGSSCIRTDDDLRRLRGLR